MYSKTEKMVVIRKGLDAAELDEMYHSPKSCPFKEGTKEWYWWSLGYELYDQLSYETADDHLAH